MKEAEKLLNILSSLFSGLWLTLNIIWITTIVFTGGNEIAAVNLAGICVPVGFLYLGNIMRSK